MSSCAGLLSNSDILEVELELLGPYRVVSELIKKCYHLGQGPGVMKVKLR